MEYICLDEQGEILMTELSPLEGFVFGVGGGSVPELYGLWQLRKIPKVDRPDWLFSYF